MFKDSMPWYIQRHIFKDIKLWVSLLGTEIFLYVACLLPEEEPGWH